MAWEYANGQWKKEKAKKPDEPDKPEKTHVDELKTYLKDRQAELTDLAMEMNLSESIGVIIKGERKLEVRRPKNLIDYHFHYEQSQYAQLTRVKKGDTIVYEQRRQVHQLNQGVHIDKHGFIRHGEDRAKPVVNIFRYGKWVEEVLKLAEEIKLQEDEEKIKLQIEQLNKSIDLFEPLEE